MTKLIQAESKPFFWLYDPLCFDSINEDYFDEAHWSKASAITHKEKGRGTTLFVQHNEHKLVLRHYLRGGLMSKVSKDHYLFSKLESTRSFSELNILNMLQAFSLPAPKPAAAQVKRQGTHYQADILIHQIPEAKDLVAILQTTQTSDFYEKLGAQIAQFHQKGVFHADLNIKNILFDFSERFWLIDFDRARIKTPARSWQRANLSRLKRSFEKEVLRHQIQWNPNHWNELMRGYKSAI